MAMTFKEFQAKYPWLDAKFGNAPARDAHGRFAKKATHA